MSSAARELGSTGVPSPIVRPSRAPAARPPRPTPSHPHRRARRGSPIAFWIMVAILAATSIIGIASLSAMLVQVSFEVDDLRTDLGVLQQDHEVLRERVAAQSSPQRVMEWAKQRGMRMPEDVVILPLPKAASEAAA